MSQLVNYERAFGMAAARAIVDLRRELESVAGAAPARLLQGRIHQRETCAAPANDFP